MVDVDLVLEVLVVFELLASLLRLHSSDNAGPGVSFLAEIFVFVHIFRYLLDLYMDDFERSPF
jgi:hypothetical protein